MTDLDTSTIWIVGYIGPGTDNAVLAATDEPDDNTDVWLAADPNDRGPLGEQEASWGGPDAVAWLAEPEPYEPAVETDTGEPEAIVGEPEAVTAAATIADIEASLARLEAIVAGVIVGQIQDSRFVDDDTEPAIPPAPSLDAVVAAATQSVTDTEGDLLDTVMERLERLERTVAELLEGSVEDVDMPDEPVEDTEDVDIEE